LIFFHYEDNATLVEAGEGHGEGKEYTTPVNVTKAGAKVGDQGVLQTQFISKGNITFQCADIKIVESKAGATGGASSFVGTFEVAFFITILASIVMVL
jgi:hypothetical protein